MAETSASVSVYVVSSMCSYGEGETYFSADRIFVEKEAAEKYVSNEMENAVERIMKKDGYGRNEINVDKDCFVVDAGYIQFEWNINLLPVDIDVLTKK